MGSAGARDTGLAWCSEVPHVVLGKGIVLWGHAEAFVIGDEHLLGGLAPTVGLGRSSTLRARASSG